MCLKLESFFKCDGQGTVRRVFLNVMGKALSGELSSMRPGPEVIKLFSCSTQLRMKFFLLINVKMPTIVGILTFMSINVKMPTIVGILTFMSRKNTILGLYEPKKAEFLAIFILLSI